MEETLFSRKEFIGRRLAAFREPKDRKGRRPQEDLRTAKAGTKFLFVCSMLMHAPSLRLSKVSLVCFSVPVSSLPFLSVLSVNQIRLFQPHSLRPPGKRPIESVSVLRESDQLKTSAPPPSLLWVLLGPGNKDNGQLSPVMASRVVREGSLRRERSQEK